MEDEIKPLDAPAVTYINTSMAVQMHDCFICKGERDKESRIVKRKKRTYFYLWKSLKINLLQVNSAQAVRQDQSRRAISRRPIAAA